jgi:hypothetical protein
MYGAELGIPPMQSMSGIAVINGRPTVYGDLGMALIRDSGLLDGWEEKFVGTFPKDDYTAICRVRRKGEEEWHEVSFSVGDAKLAKLWEKRTSKGEPTPWVTHPKRMMMWRARNVFRDVFPDVTRGFRFREEAQDDVPEDIVERSQASGLASRLPGANGAPGFTEGHVEREIGPRGSPASASEASEATPEPPEQENAPTDDGSNGTGPLERADDPVDLTTDPDFREVDDPAATESAGEGDVRAGMNGEEKEHLDQLAIDLTGASSVLEVGGVWAMWAEVFTHLSEPARLLALELVDTRKAQIAEGPKKRTRKT